VLLLHALVTRWVCDEPQPGWVQIELTDADGHVRRFEEKSAVIDADGQLHVGAQYPVDVQIACLPRYQTLGKKGLVNVVDLSPWGIGDENAVYPVERGQLSWGPPALYSDLSVCARQAVALVTFRRWRRAVGLRSSELVKLEDHLWEYATVTSDTFDTWYRSQCPLVDGDELPQNLKELAVVRGLSPDDVRDALGALVDITYGGLFGRIASEDSLGMLETFGRLTAQYGVPLVPAADFTGSLWIDDDWGRPDQALVNLWQDM